MHTKSLIPFPLKVVGAFVICLCVINFFFPHALPGLFTMAARPLWPAESPQEFQALFDRAESNALTTNALLEENEQLKALMGRATTTSRHVLAVILKRPPLSAYDTLILDIGQAEKIKPGDRVLALGNIPVGEIEEVVGETSRVRLYSSAGETFPIEIGPTHIAASAVGKGGGYFEASMPRDTKIKVGDLVLIPSLSNAFVGTVQGIASDPSEPFSKVLFRQPVNIYEMRWVLVETK